MILFIPVVSMIDRIVIGLFEPPVDDEVVPELELVLEPELEPDELELVELEDPHPATNTIKLQAANAVATRLLVTVLLSPSVILVVPAGRVSRRAVIATLGDRGYQTTDLRDSQERSSSLTERQRRHPETRDLPSGTTFCASAGRER
jgi:hypothetical protein